MIKLEHVSKSYTAGIPALNDVSLDIEEGEFVFIVGDSGSGKSTLIKLLLKELEPTEGTITINNKKLNKIKRRQIPKFRRNIGVVFQDFRLLKDRNIYDNVAFAQKVIGESNRSIKKNVPSMLSMVGLAAKYRSPNHLSGGQKQRVAIAGIMAMRPKCIILDEATAMLDPVGRKKVLDTVHKLNRDEKITIIMITHYMEEAADADYIYVMNHGKVRMEGTPREVFVQKEKLEECRLELPEISQIANGLRERGIMVPADVLTQEELVDALLKIKE